MSLWLFCGIQFVIQMWNESMSLCDRRVCSSHLAVGNVYMRIHTMRLEMAGFGRHCSNREQQVFTGWTHSLQELNREGRGAGFGSSWVGLPRRWSFAFWACSFFTFVRNFWLWVMYYFPESTTVLVFLSTQPETKKQQFWGSECAHYTLRFRVDFEGESLWIETFNYCS